MTTLDLKRVLGLPTITFIVIGTTIGGGIFVFPSLPVTLFAVCLITVFVVINYLGSNAIIELGGEIINPGRTIPRAFFIAFPVDDQGGLE